MHLNEQTNKAENYVMWPKLLVKVKWIYYGAVDLAVVTGTHHHRVKMGQVRRCYTWPKSTPPMYGCGSLLLARHDDDEVLCLKSEPRLRLKVDSDTKVASKW